MTRPLALDTSVAVPLLVQTHRAHGEVSDWWRRRTVLLCGHALAETYSVLTRLPGDIRLSPADAQRLMSQRFDPPLTMSVRTQRRVLDLLADGDIAGGAVYDALIALTAIEHDAVLATRDARARTTYEAMGATVEVAAGSGESR